MVWLVPYRLLYRLFGLVSGVLKGNLGIILTIVMVDLKYGFDVFLLRLFFSILVFPLQCSANGHFAGYNHLALITLPWILRLRHSIVLNLLSVLVLVFEGL